MIIIGVDTGGTFTDFVYIENNEVKIFKRLSTPANPAEAVLDGINRIAKGKLKNIVHGSTVATNAILERKGVKTALITNKGFEDIVDIGRQNRERLYDLHYEKPISIVPKNLRFGIKGRVLFTGEIYEDADEAVINEVLDNINKLNVESIAVSLLFSYVNNKHEKLVESVAKKYNIPISCSYQVLPEFREFERTSTTVLNAYVSPIMHRYITYLQDNLEQGDILRIMQSNGGSISAETAMTESIRTILSGPAGGAVGAFEIAKLAGFNKIITFDMGGTSTDVSLMDENLSYTYESKISGMPIKVPMIDINTVGAGGGSIAYIDEGGALRVGPESAGADPGPICYGKGEKITVTDANLYLGRLIPDYFLGGNMKLAYERLDKYFQELADDINMDKIELAKGILEIANVNMERAIRVISVEKGFNPGEFTLVSFGGAGGMHAAFLAENLSIESVLIPKNPGILSAFGMLMADVIKDYSYTIMVQEKDANYDEIMSHFAPLIEKGRKDLIFEGVHEENIFYEYFLDMRYKGQSHEITIPFDKDFVETFHNYHERFFGYKNMDKSTEIVNIRLRCRGFLEKPEVKSESLQSKELDKEAIIDTKDVIFYSLEPVKTKIINREMLNPGNEFNGPAIVVEYTSTIVIPPNWNVKVDKFGNMVLNKIGESNES
jgi:N-methylhydantoinase A